MTTTMTPPRSDRAEINRRNAQKSTGPRTPEGKNRSRFNAVKHGMTARTLVLPGEDPDALQERLDSWIGNLQPQNDVEQFLVEQAVQSSWKLDRADRAEVARFSHIIETLPVLEANRQQEEAAALGRRLFSDRNGSGSIKLQSQILEALLPGRKSQTSRPLDVLDHAGAIVRRLESTGPGCQWMLDRWIELRAILDQGQTWPSIEKSRAIRLLGKPPLNLTAEEWENHCERRRANPHPEIDGYLTRKLDRQLVEGLAQDQAATIEELRSVAEQAIARLEPLTAEHRRRAEADVARQADLLSFDTSTEGERLRRYQFSCSRSLFRSLDTLLKVRRSSRVSGSGAGTFSEEAAVTETERSELGNDCTAETGEFAETKSERGENECDPVVESGGIVADATERESSPDRENPQNEAMSSPVDLEKLREEPSAPQVEDIARRRLPFVRALISATMLVLLFGAAVRSHRDSQTEPTNSPVDRANSQIEPTAAPHRAIGGDADGADEPPRVPPRPTWRDDGCSARVVGTDELHDAERLAFRAEADQALLGPAATNPLRKEGGDWLRWRGLQDRLRRSGVNDHPVVRKAMSNACKYVIVIPDGAADEPFEGLGGKTALQAASIPEMDRVAREGIVGRSRNVPDRFLPASDVATLSLLGYDPERYYTGRAPLEAAAMGIDLGPHDWAIRCNLMTIQDGRLTDFTAGHITSPEGRELIEALQAEVARPGIEFHAGVSYRNLLIYRGQADDSPFNNETVTDPPHDYPDQPADEHTSPRTRLGHPQRSDEPRGTNSRRARDQPGPDRGGEAPANATWLWGQGRALSFPKFADLHGLRGAIISAVNLVRGVGVLAGWTRIDVPGATGYLDTDYAAKGRAAIEALRDYDIVCVHVEAPDEASHEGRADAKVEAIERIDHAVVGPVHDALKSYGRWRMVISPDHSTLLRTLAHDRAPVAWAMAGTGLPATGKSYDEFAARGPGSPSFEQGYRMMQSFLDLDWDGRTGRIPSAKS